MPVADDLFGVAYLDDESFRAGATLFGVGMALSDFPVTDEGTKRLNLVLQAASRMIDTFCGKVFTPTDLVETHELDLTTWQIRVNNPPVVSISSCIIRYAIDGTITIQTNKIHINNQQGFLEIARYLEGTLTLMEIGTELNCPVVEITYKSLQTVPKTVQLATGYQAGHLINSGYVDKTLPPNFGKVDLDGLSINNKKGYRSSQEMMAGSFSPEAERLLISERKLSIA